MLFGYAGMFLYDADAPLAERRAAALSLDSSLLAELLGSEAIRELLDQEVLAEVEQSLQRLDPARHAAARGGRRGPVAVPRRSVAGRGRATRRRTGRGSTSWSGSGGSSGCGSRATDRYVIIEDAGRMRDALGVALPVGVPEAFTEPVDDPLGDLLSRYARTHGPFPAAEVAARFGLGVAVVTGVLDRMVGTGRLVRGELRPGGTHVEYCDADVLRRVRRASLAKLRAEVEPVEPAALGRFLPVWHGVGKRLRTGPTADDVLSVVEQLAGAPLPASGFESLILPSRLPGYSPALLDELTTAGEVTWCGTGALAGGDGWIAVAPTDVADLLLPEVEEAVPDTPLHGAVLSAMDGGALFFRQLAERAGAVLLDGGAEAPTDADVVAALWDLVWSGLVTNDTIAPLRALVSGRGAAHKPRSSAPRGRYARLRGARPAMPSRTGPPTVAGRWSLVVATRTGPDPPGTRTRGGVPGTTRRADPRRPRHRTSDRRLQRRVQGVARHGGVGADRARLRRGRPRRVPVRGPRGGGPITRAVPFGQCTGDRHSGDRAGGGRPGTTVRRRIAVAGPVGTAKEKHRPARKAGALAVLVDGVPALYVERGGRSLLSFTEDERRAARGGGSPVAGR